MKHWYYHWGEMPFANVTITRINLTFFEHENPQLRDN